MRIYLSLLYVIRLAKTHQNFVFKMLAFLYTLPFTFLYSLPVLRCVFILLAEKVSQGLLLIWNSTRSSFKTCRAKLNGQSPSQRFVNTSALQLATRGSHLAWQLLVCGLWYCLSPPKIRDDHFLYLKEGGVSCRKGNLREVFIKCATQFLSRFKM
jgi:hypothetical protein